jgi:hypothetical protein
MKTTTATTIQGMKASVGLPSFTEETATLLAVDTSSVFALGKLSLNRGSQYQCLSRGKNPLSMQPRKQQ